MLHTNQVNIIMPTRTMANEKKQTSIKGFTKKGIVKKMERIVEEDEEGEHQRTRKPVEKTPKNDDQKKNHTPSHRNGMKLSKAKQKSSRKKSKSKRKKQNGAPKESSEKGGGGADPRALLPTFEEVKTSMVEETKGNEVAGTDKRTQQKKDVMEKILKDSPGSEDENEHIWGVVCMDDRKNHVPTEEENVALMDTPEKEGVTTDEVQEGETKEGTEVKRGSDQTTIKQDTNRLEKQQVAQDTNAGEVKENHEIVTQDEGGQNLTVATEDKGEEEGEGMRQREENNEESTEEINDKKNEDAARERGRKKQISCLNQNLRITKT